MSHKHDYVKDLISIGGMSDHIGQAAIYFYHSNVPLVDARQYIRNLKQTLERTGNVGFVRTVATTRSSRKER